MTKDEAINVIVNSNIMLPRCNGKTILVRAINTLIRSLEPQWIPCAEKLPGEDKYVLVCLGGDSPEDQSYCRMAVGWRENGYWNCWDDKADPRMNVIAWMPLPKPYKGGDTE